MAKRTVESKGYDNGYKDAIEKIKQMLAGGQQGGQGGQSMTPDPKLNQPDPKDNPSNNGQQSGQSGQQNSKDQQSSNGQSSQSGQRSGSGRDADSTGKKGIVRPEDCEPLGTIEDMGNEPGGMVDQKTADKVAQEEGYDQSGGSEASTEKEWSEASIKATKHLKGDQPGHGMLKGKIENIYKVSHDWKKSLRAIVGNAISPEDKRQAFAAKNALASQNRIARTDKDKFDTMSYMMAWIDSSGSMSDDQLKKCLKEIYQVALAKKPLKLVVIQCDTKIQSIKEYRDLKQLERDTINATVKGRGGTDLSPCIELLKKDPRYCRIIPELVMIFTDGDPDQFKRNPKLMSNLCWVILDRPSWTLQYKDMRTKCVHLNTADIK